MSGLPPGFPVMSIAQANALLTAPGARFEMEERMVNGASVRAYKHAPGSLRDVLQLSAGWAHREFLIYEDERVTFGAHLKAVAHLARLLRDEYGVAKGDRIAICMRNYPQWPVAFFAAISLGAIATPLNAWWTGEELEYGFSDSGAKVAILDPERMERLREHLHNLPALKHIVVARAVEEEADPRVTAMETLIGPASAWADLPPLALPDNPIDPDDDATIFYTSGTTGKPKGALATHRGIGANIFNGLACQARSFLRRGEAPPVRDPAVDDQRAGLLAIPFFHVTGAFAMLLPAVANGDKVICMYKWDPLEGIKLIERERVTSIGGVPAIAWQILEHPDRDKYDLSSILFITYGGAPSAPDLVTTIKAKFPNGTPGNGWGMTETCGTSCLNFGEDYLVRPESCGAPAPAMDFKIVGANGETMPPGQAGELWAKGPNIAKCYWNKPEATAKTFIDGWVVTGDIGRIDADGFLFIMDRAKDMLIRGGENIYCVEVENALYDHPAIMDAAVVGIAHKVLGEEVGAVVQVKPGMSVTEVEVREFVAERLAAFKVPVEVQVQTDPLPRNANGKIMKPDLRARFRPRGG